MINALVLRLKFVGDFVPYVSCIVFDIYLGLVLLSFRR